MIHSSHMLSKLLFAVKAHPIFALIVSAGDLAVAGELHPQQADLLFVASFSSQGQRSDKVTGLNLGHQDLISFLEGRSSKMPEDKHSLYFLV